MFDADFSVPESISVTDRDEEWIVADGPFVVEHNGILKPGIRLQKVSDHELVWSDGSRAYSIPQNYDLTVDDDDFTFHSEEWDSTFAFRPLRIEDASWLGLDGIESLEALRMEVYAGLDVA